MDKLELRLVESLKNSHFILENKLAKQTQNENSK